MIGLETARCQHHGRCPDRPFPPALPNPDSGHTPFTDIERQGTGTVQNADTGLSGSVDEAVDQPRPPPQASTVRPPQNLNHPSILDA